MYSSGHMVPVCVWVPARGPKELNIARQETLRIMELRQ